MIKILIVDDHPIMRFGIASIIGTQPDMRVVGQAGSGEESVDLFNRLHPDLTIMDLQLPGISGASAIQNICSTNSKTKVLVFTTYKGEDDIFQALRSGASGYLIKGVSHESLVEAIRIVHGGKTYLPPEISSKLTARTPNEILSSREREVLALIAEGDGNKQIGKRLGLTEGTVKCHVGSILGKLGVEDRTQALIIALQRGLIHI
jgi:two-component system NarL family response regulator